MTARVFQITALLMMLASAVCGRAGELPAGEKAKIETLLAHVGSLDHAKFIRNGTEYDSKSDAKFLRRKWQANEKKIKSATDFIKFAATRSSTSGKPYLIQLNGAPPSSCAGYLTARLKQIEQKPNDKSR